MAPPAPRPRFGPGLGGGLRRPFGNPLSIGRPIALGAKRLSTKNLEEYKISVHFQDEHLFDDESFKSALDDMARGEIEFKFVGEVRPSNWSPKVRHRPVEMGCSVSPLVNMAGTLGLLFRQGASFFGVSNNHVFSDDNCQTLGPILQPGMLDGGKSGRDDIGDLIRGVSIIFCPSVNQVPPVFNKVDAALMRLSHPLGEDFNGASVIGAVKGFWNPSCTGWDVRKTGRTTGLTRGVITDIGVGPMYLKYGPSQFAWFDDQIAIEGFEDKCFSDKGDSGSLVLDGYDCGVGLIFADNSGGGRSSEFVSYANPISAVLRELRLDFLLDDNL
ncbi:S1 family peptidase [Stenotrophomonas maltophilia]|uniref:S1 family peptidase n=1 Tax=Stenotrophomonas maltophilia TaxID=40324 RepID=UPI001F536E46|nr:S1 family peptidase [Stenotrophomonas maltophilia]MCI1137053.1 S1 family peptidase [Stenotrophomonas maltophilia]